MAPEDPINTDMNLAMEWEESLSVVNGTLAKGSTVEAIRSLPSLLSPEFGSDPIHTCN